jgi:hypothetical protein
VPACLRGAEIAFRHRQAFWHAGVFFAGKRIVARQPVTILLSTPDKIKRNVFQFKRKQVANIPGFNYNQS